MKIESSIASLAEDLSVVSRATAPKSTIPILEGVLIKILNENEMELTGYDMNMGIRTTTFVHASAAGAFVVNPKLLLDILRKLPGETVSLETEEENRLTVRSGVILFTIPTLPAENFPELPILQNETAISLPENLLRSMISGTIFSVSDNQTKPLLTGSLFQFYGRQFTVVALDQFRMSVRRELVDRPDDAPNLRFVVPGRTLRELERSLSETDTPIRLCLTKKSILFQSGRLLLISKLLEGEYMNFENALPDNTDYIYHIRASQAIESLERIGIIISDTYKTRTTCRFCADILQISCQTSTSRAYDECPVETLAGEEMEISFNNRYLLEALRAAYALCGEKEDTVELRMSGRLNSCVLQAPEGNRFTYLILPIRPIQG